MDRVPLLPVEEEGRLHDLPCARIFVERVFCYRRWRDLVAGGLTRGKLVAFTPRTKLLLMAHSPKHYTDMGRLVAAAKAHTPRELESRYGELFMAAAQGQGHGQEARERAAAHLGVLQARAGRQR